MTFCDVQGLNLLVRVGTTAAGRRIGYAVAIIVAWLVSLPLWVDLKEWQVAIHTVTSIITLLLLTLLENAGRRSEEASQEKPNMIAEALAALMASRAGEDRDLQEAAPPRGARSHPRTSSSRGSGSR